MAREDADANNIWSIMNSENLQILPLVIGTNHHNRIRRLLKDLV